MNESYLGIAVFYILVDYAYEIFQTRAAFVFF